MKYESILETIGNTPVVKLSKLFPEAQKNGIEIWIKLEKVNPGGSIKDRIGLAMIEDAERRGLLQKGSIIIEPTSGNTGVGLALVAATKGYRLILTMPESMSIERRKLLTLYGAELVLTPKEKGMKGAIEKAQELLIQNPGAWMPMQFDNQVNVNIHRLTTAQEIIKDFPSGVDYLITGVGTGGHITGVGEVLSTAFPRIKILAVEPQDSAVLSGGTAGPHALQGLGAGFIPSILNIKILDSIVQVTKEEAYAFAQDIGKIEGIHVGVSTGASLAAISKTIASMPEKSTVLTFAYDTGERYLSIEGLY